MLIVEFQIDSIMKKKLKYTKVKRVIKGKKKLLDTGGYIYDDNKSEFANMVAQNAHLSKMNNEARNEQAGTMTDGINSEMESVGATAGMSALSGASTGMSIAGPMGALAGTVIGAGAGVMSANKRNVAKFNATSDIENNRRQQEKLQATEDAKFQSDAYANVLENSNTTGRKGVKYFAKGGNLPNDQVYAGKGGNLKELSSDVDIIKGKSHAQGGVDLKANGKVIAEAEGDEVIKDDNMVFSDKLGYAKIAEKIAKKKAKFEKDLKSTDVHRRNTATRMTANLDKELDSLFAQQEASKPKQSGAMMANGGDLDTIAPLSGASSHTNSLLQATSLLGRINMSKRMQLERELALPESDDDRFGEFPTIEIDELDGNLEQLEIPTMGEIPSTRVNRKQKVTLADGGKLLQGAQFALPLIENVVNNQITKKTPQLSRHEILKPQLQTASELETDVDINPQLAQIDNQTKAFNTSIDRGTNNANVGRANKLMAHISNIEHSNKLRSDKANTETNLRNKNKLNKQQVRNTNTGAINAYTKLNADNKFGDDMREFQRRDEIMGRKSANMANLTEDLMKGIQAVGERKLDNRKIDLDMMKYDSGVQAKMLGDSTFVQGLKNDKGRQDTYKEMIKDRPDAVKRWNSMFPKNRIL